MFAGDGAGESGVIFDAIRAGQDVYGNGFLNGLACVLRLEMGDRLIALNQKRRCAVQDAPTLHTRGFGPKLLRLGRAGHSLVDLCLLVDLDCCEHLSCCRIDRVKAVSLGGGRSALQVARDEIKNQIAGQTILKRRPSVHRRAQPNAINHRGDGVRHRLHVAGVDQLAQIKFQIGQHPLLVRALHPRELRHMQRLSPEGQPDAGRFLGIVVMAKMGVDQGLNARTWPGGEADSCGGVTVQLPRDGSEGSF